jgi:hypothetical protein
MPRTMPRCGSSSGRPVVSSLDSSQLQASRLSTRWVALVNRCVGICRTASTSLGHSSCAVGLASVFVTEMIPDVPRIPRC